MMLKIIGLAAAAALLAGAAHAEPVAETPEDAADLQCMVALTALAGQNPEMQQQLAVPVFYYLGRLEGRSPGVDWFRRMHSYGETVTLEELNRHIERCSNYVVERGRAMATAGQAMIDSAQ